MYAINTINKTTQNTKSNNRKQQTPNTHKQSPNKTTPQQTTQTHNPQSNQTQTRTHNPSIIKIKKLNNHQQKSINNVNHLNYAIVQ